jgi:signal transduction histidine kinase
VHSDLEARPPAAVEAAAYYVVAESLTNVGKHSGARSATVSLHGEPGVLRVDVADDGAGGARRVAGSGLEGLAQRVEALDGSLTVESRDGEGTKVTAVIPCAW